MVCSVAHMDICVTGRYWRLRESVSEGFCKLPDSTWMSYAHMGFDRVIEVLQWAYA